MKHMRLGTAAGIIALVILLGFVLSVPHTREIAEVSQPEVTTEVPAVTLRDTFKKGVHTITGAVEAQNACATASAEASVAGDATTTESILVAITVLADTDLCLELPTRVPFQTTVTAPARLPILVTVNGAPASTTAP